MRSAVTDRAWASGIIRSGFAVVAVAVGLLGSYPEIVERAVRVTFSGAAIAGVAASAAPGSILRIGTVRFAGTGSGTRFPRPTDIRSPGVVQSA